MSKSLRHDKSPFSGLCVKDVNQADDCVLAKDAQQVSKNNADQKSQLHQVTVVMKIVKNELTKASWNDEKESLQEKNNVDSLVKDQLGSHAHVHYLKYEAR